MSATSSSGVAHHGAAGLEPPEAVDAGGEALARSAAGDHRPVARQRRVGQAAGARRLGGDGAELRAGVDDGRDPPPVEQRREEQVAGGGARGGDRHVGAGPVGRRVRAALPLVQPEPAARQVDVDVEVAQHVGAQQAVERRGRGLRDGDVGDQQPAPGQRRAAGREAAQLDLTGADRGPDAGQPMVQLDPRRLRPDALRRGGRERGELGAGVEDHRERAPVGGQRRDRHVARDRQRHVAEPPRRARPRPRPAQRGEQQARRQGPPPHSPLRSGAASRSGAALKPRAAKIFAPSGPSMKASSARASAVSAPFTSANG